MAIQWNQSTDGHYASADTRFIRLHITPDYRHSHSIEDARYEAQMLTINGRVLVATDNLLSMDAAQEWCVAQYRTLLEQELVSLELETQRAQWHKDHPAGEQ